MKKDYYEENTGVFLFGIYDTVKRTDSDPSRTHLHAEPEIALVTCGSAEYLLGTDRFEVRENDVVFIPPNVAHAVFSPCDAGLKTLTARISPYCLWEVFAEFTDDGKIAALLSGKMRGKICSPSVARLFSELAEAFRGRDRYDVKIAMLNLIAEICKSVESEKALPKKNARSRSAKCYRIHSRKLRTSRFVVRYGECGKHEQNEVCGSVQNGYGGYSA